MPSRSEAEITEAVLRRVSEAADLRVRQVSQALIRHLHAFVCEVGLTETEWKAGIDFLTSVGRMCSETRQEYILLSDTLGVSMLVDAINHRFVGEATESTVFGPFYVQAPVFENGAQIARDLEGVPMFIGGSVKTANGDPLRGASVDVWHSDHRGLYDLQKLDAHHGISGRGRFITDDRGHFHLWTVRPAPYPIPNDGPVGRMLAAQGRHPYRPEHVHFMIAQPGYRCLVTHLFAEGSEYLDSDVVFGVKESLIKPFKLRMNGYAPDSRVMSGPWVELQHDFILEAEGGRSR